MAQQLLTTAVQIPIWLHKELLWCFYKHCMAVKSFLKKNPLVQRNYYDVLLLWQQPSYVCGMDSNRYYSYADKNYKKTKGMHEMFHL